MIRRTLAALAFWLVFLPRAEGGIPTYTPIAPQPNTQNRLLGKLEDLLEPAGLNRISVPLDHRFAGIDGMFTDQRRLQAVFVRFSIKVSERSLLGRIVASERRSTFLYHGVFQGRVFAIFTVGMSHRRFQFLVSRLENWETAERTVAPSRTPASEIIRPSQYPERPTTRQHGCLDGILTGAYDSTLGLLAGAAQTMIHPIESVAGFWNGVWKAWEFSARFWNDFVGTSEQLYSGFKDLPNDTKRELACRVLSTVGVGTVVAAWTTGTAIPLLSEKIAMTVNGLRKPVRFAEARPSAEVNSNLLPFLKKGKYVVDYDLVNHLSIYQKAMDTHLRWAKTIPGTRPVIIDAGAGTGNMALAVQQTLPNATVYALDLSPEMLAKAVKKGLPTKFTSVSDLAELKMPNGRRFAPASADHILSHSVLWALKEPADFFGEANRVLKKGGTLAVSTSDHPTDDLVKGFIASLEKDLKASERKGLITPAARTNFVESNREFPKRLNSPLSKSELIELGRKSGFEVVEHQPAYVVNTSTGEKPLFHQLLFRKL